MHSFKDRAQAVKRYLASLLPLRRVTVFDPRSLPRTLTVDDVHDALAHLLDYCLWPVSLVEKTFRPSTRPGLRYELAELIPVPYARLSYQAGKLEILPTQDGARSAAVARSPSRAATSPTAATCSPCPTIGAAPMRALLFWWLLSMMSRDWWGRFLDRYGAPFVVGRYQDGDEESRSVLWHAFQAAQKLGGLVVTSATEIEIKQAATTDSGEAYKAFVELCNREKSKLILGETLSSDAQPTGLGSGTSKEQAEKRADKRQSDARRLAATLRHQLFAQYLRINGYRGRPPIAVWGSLSGNESETTGSLVADLATAGLEVADEGIEILSERTGLPLRRRAVAPPVASMVQPFAAPAGGASAAQSATDVIATKSAPALAAMMGGDLAPIRTIILNSRSSDEAIAGVQAFCAARFDPSRSARVMEEALVAITANGAAAWAR